jgi:hypothetical protein
VQQKKYLEKCLPKLGAFADKHESEIPNVFEAFSSRLSHELGLDQTHIQKEMNKPRNVAKHYIREHMEENDTFRISQGSVESMLLRCIAQYSMVVDQSTVPAGLKEKYSRFLVRVMSAPSSSTRTVSLTQHRLLANR